MRMLEHFSSSHRFILKKVERGIYMKLSSIFSMPNEEFIKYLDGLLLRKENNGGLLFLPKLKAPVVVTDKGLEIAGYIKEHLITYGNLDYSALVNTLEYKGISNWELDSFLNAIKLALGEYGKYVVSINPNKTFSSKNYPKIGDPKISSIIPRPKSPIRLVWEITKNCNFSCNFCYVYGDKNVGKDLSFDEMCNIIKQASDMEVFYFVLLGGEPLLRKEFYSIIREIREYDMYSTVITNGYLIKQQLAALKLMPPMPVVVSLHGNPMDYAKYMNLDDLSIAKRIFNQIVENIRLLRSENIEVHIKSVVSTINIQNLWDHLVLLDSLGVSHVTLLHYLPIGKGAINNKPALLTPKMLVQFFEIVDKANRELDVSVDYRPFISIYAPALTPEFNYDNCPTGTMDLRIRYDGKVIQCSGVRDIFLGDLRQEPLKRIWEDALNRRDLTKCPFVSGRFPLELPEYSYHLLEE
ncbi:radical SAM protein [Thermococcus eurythermalis]|nr:radical SAM protein [Thermococcus eurythermalis]